MQALRNIYTVTDNRLTINLPEYFKYSAVEVIILPVEKSKNEHSQVLSKEERLNQLLSIGVWSEKDVQPIIETKNLINQWKIQDF